jgi:hypothetical protein
LASDFWGHLDCTSVCCFWAFGIWFVGLEEFCLRNSSVRFPWTMGAFCSCLQPDYSDHHGNHTSSAFRNCMCLRCFTQQLINAVCCSHPGCFISYILNFVLVNSEQM